VFTSANFAQPTFGSEGNERFNHFVQQDYMQSDVALLKNIKIRESTALQLRFEFFNVFNRPNLTSMDTNLPDANFGKATGQLVPRFIQVGANLKF
jgi:hypothetical protein